MITLIIDDYNQEVVVTPPSDLTYILPADPYVYIQGLPGEQGPQGVPGEQGAPGEDALWNFTGPYNIGLSYSIGDVVTYNGETFYRTNPNGGNVGDTPSYASSFWALIAEKGAAGPQGLQGENIELQVTSTHIQWRVVGSLTWIDLVSIASLTGLPPSDSWFVPFPALTADDVRLENATFPKTFTLPPVGRVTTIIRLSGLINTLSNTGSANITIQHGLSSYTNITGLVNLSCTNTVLFDQVATANNVIPIGNRIRVVFNSITDIVNLSFRLDYSEVF